MSECVVDERADFDDKPRYVRRPGEPISPDDFSNIKYYLRVIAISRYITGDDQLSRGATFVRSMMLDAFEVDLEFEPETDENLRLKLLHGLETVGLSLAEEQEGILFKAASSLAHSPKNVGGLAVVSSSI